MSYKKLTLNYPRTKLDSQAMKTFRRVVILAILLGTLAFVTSERAAVNVQATDCSTAWMNLEGCYYGCAGVSDFSQRVGCFGGCEFTHAEAGATCSMPSHSPMMVTGGGCDPAANGQRAYDNCMAGTLYGSWQDQYLIYMAYYNDMEISCGMIGQGVEAQGCY